MGGRRNLLGTPDCATDPLKLKKELHRKSDINRILFWFPEHYIKSGVKPKTGIRVEHTRQSKFVWNLKRKQRPMNKMQYRLFVTPWWISQPVLALVIAKYAAHYHQGNTNTTHTRPLDGLIFVPVILGTEWHDWERELDSPCCPYAPFAGARHLSAARPTLASKICRSPAGDNAQRKRERQSYSTIIRLQSGIYGY